MDRLLQASEIPSDAKVLDARTASQFSVSHVPGARHAEFVAPKFVIRDAVGLELFHTALQDWIQIVGLLAADAVVVYDSGLDARASRTAWALEYAGFEVSILNGGFQQWVQVGLPTSSEAVEIEPSAYKIQIRSDILATVEDILNRSVNTVVLDARDALEYSGQKIPPGATRGGHIPGAQHFEWTRVLDLQGFQTASQLERTLQEFPRDAEIIVHCQSGARSAVLYHAFKSQGFRVRNYLGSMNEWLNQSDLAVE